MKLEKPIIQTSVEDITYKDYSWSKYFYETYYDTSYDDTTQTLVFEKKGGSMYPPFYYADFLELQDLDKVMMKRLEEKIAARGNTAVSKE